MKRFLIILGCAALAVALTCSCGNKSGKKAAAQEVTEEADTLAYGWDNLPEEPIFDIVTTKGTIRVKLYSKTPKHRDNFIKLVKAHYYDGVLFHRVINNFMIQAGDPLTKDPTKADQWGTGGPSYTIPAEFVPEYYHKKGALAAARRGDAANPKKASHGSQFYLVQDEFNCLQLDGEYTVFGETVQGLEVIDRIAAVPTDAQDRPLKNVKILSITLSEDQTLTADSPNPFEDYDFDDEEDEIDEAAANAAVAEEQPQEQGTEVQAVADTVEVQTEIQAEPQTEAQLSEEQEAPVQEPEQQAAPADTTDLPKPEDD